MRPGLGQGLTCTPCFVHSGATTSVNVPVKVVAAGIACRADEPTRTIKLALEAGPDEQSCAVADDVWPTSADPVAREVPVVWPDVPDHSTVYGTTGNAPFASVNALAAPLPVAVTRYPRVAVLLHTHKFWATAALADGSELVRSTSVRPEIRTLAGTDALILTLPVEVAPKVPWVDACAVPAVPSSSSATSPLLMVAVMLSPSSNWSILDQRHDLREAG